MKRVARNIVMLLSFYIFLSSCTPLYLGLLDVVVNDILENKDEFYQNHTRKAYSHIGELYSENKNYKMTKKEFKGVKYFLYQKKPSENLIVYVHGGAFVRIKIYQVYVKMMQDILNRSKSNYDIAFLDYKGRKYPEQNIELDTLIDHLMPQYKKVILMGDSSGGNIILSNTLKRRDSKKRLADSLILLSPWADPSNRVKSRYTNYKKDILMGKSMYNRLLIYNPYIMGKNLNTPLISPVYGDFKNFPETLIQYGGLEILADDSIIVCKKINAAGSKCTLEEYANMPHVFQLYRILDKTYPARLSIGGFIDKTFLKGIKWEKNIYV